MYKDMLSSWIDEHSDEMTEDIFRLVRIDSTKGEKKTGCPFGEGPKKALLEAGSILEGYGLDVKNMDNIVLVADYGEGSENSLDVLAHLDVVPAVAKDWRVTHPFDPVIKNGRYYGRGVADDKGPAIAAVYALRAIKELGIKTEGRIRIILGTDEESGSEDIEYYYNKEKPARFTISPDADFPVINVEKGRFASGYTGRIKCNGRLRSVDCGTGDNVIPGECRMIFSELSEAEMENMRDRAKGLGVLIEYMPVSEGTAVLVKGKSGHAAEPYNATNALTAALSLISPLLSEDGMERAVLQLAELFPFGDHYGEAAGIASETEICGKLTISLDRLYVSEDNLDCTYDCRMTDADIDVRGIMDGAVPDGLLPKAGSMTRPHIVDGESDFVRTLLACYEEVTGKKGYTISIGGGTYVHDVEGGVAFGPADYGTPTNIHGNDENILIEDLKNAAVIYALAMLRLCKGS